MHAEIDGLIDDHNQALIDAEQEKQQEISHAEKKINALNEKLSKKQMDLQEKSNTVENLRRENGSGFVRRFLALNFVLT